MLPPSLLNSMSRLYGPAAALAACLWHPAVLAQGPVTGVVTALYVEHAPGVLVARPVSPRHRGAIWAEISSGRPGDPAGRLFRVPEGMSLAPGDRIPVSLAGPSSAVGAGSRIGAAPGALLPCVPR